MQAISKLHESLRNPLFYNARTQIQHEREKPHRTRYHATILSASAALNESRAALNLSVTTSQRSIRSSRPFWRASVAVVSSSYLSMHAI